MSVFTKAFWVSTIELVLVAFAGTFASSLTFTNGTPNWHGFVAAAIAGGIAAIYALVAQLKGVQALKAGTTPVARTATTK